jgi:hypothetical protein
MIFEKATWGVLGKLLGRLEMQRAMGVNTLKKSYMLEFDSSPFFGIFGHFLGGFGEYLFS